ncbi:Trypsin [Popillia japonica]|uniref:Trypsin n=1 Tax=Popillia japonica TaxID=7064 RepID=A0AAW1KGA9_POPJA
MFKIFAILISFSQYVDNFDYFNVPETYVDTPFPTPIDVGNNDYSFVVKVVVINQTLAVGVCINRRWILTAKFFEEETDEMLVTTWDKTEEDAGGQVRKVVKVFVNPLLNIGACNYDAALLKLNKSFDPTKSINKVRFKDTAPRSGDIVLIVAPYPSGISATQVMVESWLVLFLQKSI